MLPNVHAELVTFQAIRSIHNNNKNVAVYVGIR